MSSKQRKANKTTDGDGPKSHDHRGRFAKGNQAAKGRSRPRYSVAEYRRAIEQAVSPDDLFQIIANMVEAAKRGELKAAIAIMDRLLGRPSETAMIERVEKLEELLERMRHAEG